MFTLVSASKRIQHSPTVGENHDGITDERGQVFSVRIVATLADTILQGDLLIDERRFEELFPTAGGHRRFLVDAPEGAEDEVARTLSRGLEDVGLALVKGQTAKPDDKETDLMPYVQQLLDIHDKYTELVGTGPEKGCFQGHTIFHKAMKEAFEE